MIKRPMSRTPLREVIPERHGTSAGLLAYSASKSVVPVPFFNIPANSNEEAGSIGVVKTHLRSGSVKPRDHLMNFAETLLTASILADRASEDLLRRSHLLLVSLQNKDGADEQHKEEFLVRESERNVFA